MRRWACIPWVSRGRCTLACVWYGIFSLGVLLALYHFVFVFMFLSYSLLHLEGYRIQLKNQSVLVVCLHILRVNRVLLSEGLKLFSVIKAHVA